MIYGFKYNGRALSEFEMMTANPSDVPQFSSREMDKSDMTAMRSIPNYYSAHYSDVATIPFLIIKQPEKFLTQEELVFTEEDINNVRAWLESPKRPAELVTFEDDAEDVVYYGLFTNMEPFVIAQECYGFSLTFSCNSPYGFSHPVVRTCHIDGDIDTFHLVYNNTSAEQDEYLKPTITIYAEDTFEGTERITIKNNSDDGQTMELVMPEGRKELVIDCRKKLLTDENNGLVSLSEVGMVIDDSEDEDIYNIVSAGTYPIYWLNLLPNENHIDIETLTENTISKIEISARMIKKVGGF